MTKPRSIVISLAIVPAAMLAGLDGDDVFATTVFDIEGTNDGTLVNHLA